MITTVTTSGIIGTEIDVEEFFAAQGIDLEAFNAAATGHLALLVTGEANEFEFNLVPGDYSSRVLICVPTVEDGGYETYAHVGGKLVTVRLNALLST